MTLIMTYRTVAFLFYFFLPSFLVFSQTEASFFKHINHLCSDELHGRGAEFKGDSVAANYLAEEYKKVHITSIEGSYFQHFTYSVNTFPGAYKLSINGNSLKAGEDFVASASSKSGQGKFNVVRLTTENWNDATFRSKFFKKSLSKTVLIYDYALNAPTTTASVQLTSAKQRAAGLIELLDQDPIANEFGKQLTVPTFQINKKRVEAFGELQTVEFELKATLVEQYRSQNVIGVIKGSEQPEDYLVVSAHYDHLGYLGKETRLQGANDNASGVAMLLSLAEYYGKSANQPKKSLVFICFAAEEIGLLGSKHFVENPLVPIEQTNFVLNLDLMGSGSEGITVVNGKELDHQYEILTTINNHHNFVSEITSRPNRANSDHFYFTEKKVPAFFVYARGKVGGYHNVGDTVDQLEREQFDGLFGLFVTFLNEL